MNNSFNKILDLLEKTPGSRVNLKYREDKIWCCTLSIDSTVINTLHYSGIGPTAEAAMHSAIINWLTV